MKKRKKRRLRLLIKALILAMFLYGIYMINDTTIAIGVLYNRGQF